MAESNNRRPGDVFLNRYMPYANEAERESARANLYEFAAVLLRIFTRLAREDREQAIRANCERELNYDAQPRL